MSTSIADFAFRAYQFLLPVAWIALGVAILLLIPLALFRKTRVIAGIGLLMASWMFGATTWLLGTTVTFATYGWIGLLVGWLLVGVGVVPIAIFAAFFTLGSPVLGVTMIVMSLVVLAARGAGAALANS